MKKYLLPLLFTFGFSMMAVAQGNSIDASNGPEWLNKEQVAGLFNKEVTNKVELTNIDINSYKKLIDLELTKKPTTSQYMVVVDKNENKQTAFLVFYDRQRNDIEFIGGTKVSTGKRGRAGYFITPSGVFENTPNNMSWRALGTKNELGVRGLGVRGMRVYDFGWAKANRGWGTGETNDIRFAMHATDPDLLEKRLGQPASMGCIRIHTTFNRFLDKYGILDKHYETNPKSHWALLKDRMPVKEQGSLLIVINSQN